MWRKIKMVSKHSVSGVVMLCGIDDKQQNMGITDNQGITCYTHYNAATGVFKLACLHLLSLLVAQACWSSIGSLDHTLNVSNSNTY